jgi:hypothetical protein
MVLATPSRCRRKENEDGEWLAPDRFAVVDREVSSRVYGGYEPLPKLLGSR